ncbi:hypothetical protein L1987_33433 [Smallanthus sonchifolius]|uniref:Uncharacterized protein n=1 Tax=Smallanthus sonchifolius TaxID=185202 RepID=A0ACB9HQT9_9ASTR|nr:hypothetical protein L1987_33433 [Smallanthus sonchifolius]
MIVNRVEIASDEPLSEDGVIGELAGDAAVQISKQFARISAKNMYKSEDDYAIPQPHNTAIVTTSLE